MRNIFGALVIACALPTGAAALETLDALEECPKSDVPCIPLYANLQWPGTPSDQVSDHPAVEEDLRTSRHDYGHVVVRVRGRLDGGEPKPYRLKLSYPTDQLGCNDFIVAARSSRPEGGGTILTRQGVLEILSTDIGIGDRHHFALIDPDTGRKSIRLAPGWETTEPWMTRFVKLDGRVFWRTPNGLCLNIDTDGPFRRVADAECSGRQLSEASAEDIERVRKTGIFTDAYVIERLKYDLWRLDGAPFTVYIWGVACT